MARRITDAFHRAVPPAIAEPDHYDPDDVAAMLREIGAALVETSQPIQVVEQRLRACCEELGLQVLAWLDSPIEGGDGNREFFIHARKAREVAAVLADAPARQAARRQPRSEARKLSDEDDRQAAHDGQPGPARRKRKTD